MKFKIEEVDQFANGLVTLLNTEIAKKNGRLKFMIPFHWQRGDKTHFQHRIVERGANTTQGLLSIKAMMWAAVTKNYDELCATVKKDYNGRAVRLNFVRANFNIGMTAVYDQETDIYIIQLRTFMNDYRGFNMNRAYLIFV